MKFINQALLAAAILMLAVPAAAQEDAYVPYDTVNGEQSIGTQAPTVERMQNVIQNGSPQRLAAILEYGERVECHECVPLLEEALLESDDATVREMAAWWLRRRPFAIGAVTLEIRTVLAEDADPVRRARAAEALGTFMNPRMVPYLTDALSDSDAGVRAAAVSSLGRLNTPASNAGIAQAFSDADRDVREAAVASALYVNSFRQYDGLMGLLADSDTMVRRRAALAVGTFRVESAVPALSAMLSDESFRVRQSAAWALGRIGTSEARQALMEGRATETESLVLDAYDVALAMR